MLETIRDMSGEMCIFASSINRFPNMQSKKLKKNIFHNIIVGFRFP